MMMMKTIKQKENWFNSYNIRVFTPESTLHVQITENKDDEPFMIFITGPKNAAPVQIWISAVQNLINHLWSLGVSTSKIITLLDTPYGPKYAQNDNGIRIYSGPDGIRWALTQYLQIRSSDKRRTELNVGGRVG